MSRGGDDGDAREVGLLRAFVTSFCSLCTEASPGGCVTPGITPRVDRYHVVPGHAYVELQVQGLCCRFDWRFLSCFFHA